MTNISLFGWWNMVLFVKLGALDSRDELGSFGGLVTAHLNFVQLGFSGFCEMSCVKYCVYAYPSGYPTVQTSGGTKRAMS